jgi:Zn-dependent protease
MRWSIPAGSLFGIPIKIHIALVALVLVLVPVIGRGEDGEVDVLFGIGIVVALFGSVLVHEFGHALVARRYGVKTREIVLLPIGGIAVLSESPKKPMHELWIALAGPMTSLALAALAFLALAVGGPEFFSFLGALNLALGIFNMLPAFPLDGGRVLRAGLSHWLGAARGTAIAVRIGRVLAILLVGFGVAGGQWALAIIGVFVFVAAGTEARQARLREVLRSQRVSDWMEPVVRIFSATTPASELEAMIAETDEGRAFPVTYGDEILGVIHRKPIADAIASGLRLDFLHEALDRNVVTIHPDAPLEELLQALSRNRSQAAVVVDEDHGVQGVLTIERLQEALSS